MFDIALSIVGPLACAGMGWLLRGALERRRVREARRDGWGAGWHAAGLLVHRGVRR